LNELLFCVAAYLIGSIPFGLIVGKVFGSVDVRQHGSGNIGTSNVMRTVGKGAALLVLVLDVLKGTLPVWAAIAYGASPLGVAAVALFAVVGHNWPIFLGFQGGKGIATTLGVLFALDWRVALLLLAIWIVCVAITRYISLSSLIAAAILPFLVWLFGNPAEYVAGGALISLFAFWRHKSNIARLRAGTEYKFGERAGTERR